MYYQEKVIEGVLMYRTTPSGEFHALSPEEMTQMIQGLCSEILRLKEDADNLKSNA